MDGSNSTQNKAQVMIGRSWQHKDLKVLREGDFHNESMLQVLIISFAISIQGSQESLAGVLQGINYVWLGDLF